MTVRLLQLGISNFRGIKNATIDLSGNVALIGPNGAGKSTIIDALCLAFGRQKLVPVLTEHDFTGGCPSAPDRFTIVATIGGFKHKDPDRHHEWFRKDRGVPKWWNPKTRRVAPSSSSDDDVLCVQIGLMGRFDQEQLEVEIRRYFHDSDKIRDAFDEDTIVVVPGSLLNEIGFYVLPARRTWESAASFGSELFRRTVAGSDAFPADSVLAQRDLLRKPSPPLELDPKLSALVERVNLQLGQLMPGHPKFQLRVTATDSDSLLKALIPHYERDGQPSLPASRQGTGLLALQSFVILQEIGRARRDKGWSFILALEEPELHVAPGLQRRIISSAVAGADQVLCTTHSPEVAAAFRAEEVRILRPGSSRLEAIPLLEANSNTARNTERRLAQDFRAESVDALMHDIVLVPEGRIDHEWLRLLSDVALGAPVDTATAFDASRAPAFGTVLATIPTPNAHVRDCCEFMIRLHPRVVALVDGDTAGDDCVPTLTSLVPPLAAVIQWPAGWSIEHVVAWIVAADEATVLAGFAARSGQRPHTDAGALLTALLSDDSRAGGLKGNYLAHQDLAASLSESPRCVARTQCLLDIVTRAALAPAKADSQFALVGAPSAGCPVMRVQHEPPAT